MPSPKHLRALAHEIGVPYERVLDAALIDRGYREERGGQGRLGRELNSEPTRPFPSTSGQWFPTYRELRR